MALDESTLLLRRNLDEIDTELGDDPQGIRDILARFRGLIDKYSDTSLEFDYDETLDDIEYLARTGIDLLPSAEKMGTGVIAGAAKVTINVVGTVIGIVIKIMVSAFPFFGGIIGSGVDIAIKVITGVLAATTGALLKTADSVVDLRAPAETVLGSVLEMVEDLRSRKGLEPARFAFRLIDRLMLHRVISGKPRLFLRVAQFSLSLLADSADVAKGITDGLKPRKQGVLSKFISTFFDELF
jgi:hypothetical protein